MDDERVRGDREDLVEDDERDENATPMVAERQVANAAKYRVCLCSFAART